MIGGCPRSFSRLSPASLKRVLRRDWCNFPANHIRLNKDVHWLRRTSASFYQPRMLQCDNQEWMEIQKTPYSYSTDG